MRLKNPFQQAQAIQQDKSLELNVEVPEISVGKWSPPLVGFVKINWDVAMEAKKGTVGLGLVTRSSTGRLLTAHSMLKKANADPVMAKALAALHAIIFGREMGYNKVIFEGDS